MRWSSISPERAIGYEIDLTIILLRSINEGLGWLHLIQSRVAPFDPTGDRNAAKDLWIKHPEDSAVYKIWLARGSANNPDKGWTQ